MNGEEAVLIIGNGFDKSLGLPTAYSDFISSPEFVKIDRNINLIARFTKQFSLNKNWSGIEADLIKIENLLGVGVNYELTEENVFAERLGLIDSSPEQFKKYYLELVSALKEYLIRISKDFSFNQESLGFKMFEYVFTNFITDVYSFNYTNTIHNCFDELIKESKTNLEPLRKRIHYVHGNLVSDDIIFGINDKSINDSFNSYLLKSTHKNYGNTNVIQDLGIVKHIFFFGFSLGDTDHDYFRDFFSSYTENKNVIIYYYNNNASDEFNRMLYEITENNLGEFKNKNNFTFINCDKVDPNHQIYFKKKRNFN